METPAAARRPAASVLARVGMVLLGNGFYMAGGFLANVLAANGLTPGDFGHFSIALAIMMVANELVGTGFDLAMVQLANRNAAGGAARVAQVMRASLHLKLVLSAAVAAVVLALSGPIAAAFLGDAGRTAPVRWAAVGVVGTSLFQHLLARYQSEERFRAYAAAKSANSLLKLALLAGLWVAGWFSLDAVLAVYVLVLFASFAAGMAFAGAAAGAPAPGGEPGLWKEVLWIGRWMIVTHLLFTLYARIDIFFLGWLREAAEVGHYTVAWNFGFLIDLCTYSFITALLPQASRMRDRSDFHEYGRRTLRACALVAVGLTPLYAFADPVIRLLFPAYVPAVEVFRVLFWGCLITLLTHPLYLIVYQRDRVPSVALGNLILVAVAAFACWHLVPEHGMLGAAYAMVIARAVNGGFVLYLVDRELRALSAPA